MKKFLLILFLLVGTVLIFLYLMLGRKKIEILQLLKIGFGGVLTATGLDKLPFLRKARVEEEQNEAEEIAKESLALPVHYSLPQDKIVSVANQIKRFLQS